MSTITQISPSTSPAKACRVRLWRWIGAVALIFLMAAVLSVRSVIARAEPILRTRVIETLSNRFRSRVELASFQVSLIDGVEVSGTGLKIFGATDPNLYQQGVQPLVSVPEFRFHTSLRSLFISPMHVGTVYLKGLELNIPPQGNRQEMTRMGSRTGKRMIFVDEFVGEDALVVINTSNPNKPPLKFPISALKMKDVGPGQPLQFNAILTNPKPVGNIASTGLFGPLLPDAPGDTPVQGKYSFRDADLSTIKGIGGILSSTGQYSGTLNNIVVHGQTDTPDFKIASSDHPVALHTEFQAVVDGTSGDTYLKPVQATFLHTSFTAQGSVIRATKTGGHDIELEVALGRARIEDLLKLGVRADPALMTGPVEMKTKLSLAPGDAAVADRLKLAGDFHVREAHFSNQKLQGKLDSLSLSSQGKPKLARQHIEENVPVDLQGVFALKNGLLSFSFLHFLIPGAHIDLTGDYGLDAQSIDFHGKAMLDARVSQMTTGWKSIVLKPIDPFFSKNGAGTEVPIKITGTQSGPHFGLDFHRKNDKETSEPKNNARLNRQ